MKRKLVGRILSCFLAAALMLQPLSAEAAQASTDLETVQFTEDFEETQPSEDKEEMRFSEDLEEVRTTEELEETQPFTDSEEMFSEDLETVQLAGEADEGTALALSEETKQEEMQKVTVESTEGLFQAGSFQVPNRNGEEIALLGAGEEDKWEQWDAYVYAALKDKSEVIDVSDFQIPTGEIEVWYIGVINEHPDLYYVSGKFSYYTYDRVTVSSIVPEYLPVTDEAAFQAATEEALSVLRDDMSELEKAVALHDYIILNCEYDYERYLSGVSNLPEVSFSAYGALVERMAVCQGYALAYKYLLEKAGITCYYVSSSAMSHAWNMIVLDGKAYQVDTTWDDPAWDLIGRVGHSNMFRSDAAFEGHHDWTVSSKGEILNITADDTTYDNYFWSDVTSPFVWADGKFYYIDRENGSINSTDIGDGTGNRIYSGIGRWYVWGDMTGYWPKCYSGLFLIGNRLYFNSPTAICSILLDGTDKRTEFTADTSEGYIYGSAYCQGEVRYSLHQNPNLTEKEEVLTATLSGEIPVSQITLNRTTLELAVGESAALTADVFPADATKRTVTWSSSNEEVASVTAAGVVQAKKAGECVITAAAGGKNADCTVTVTEGDVSAERLNTPVFSPEAGLVEKGTKVTITSPDEAEIYYTTDGTIPNRESSRYEAPIGIEEDMTIRAVAVKEGYQDSEIASAAYRIDKIPVSRIELSNTKLTLEVGESAALTAEIFPADAAEQTVTWSSSKEDVAVVTAEGVVTAKKAGGCVITAEAGGKFASCSVVVTGYIGKVAEPVFSPTEGLVEKGTKVTITSPDGAVIHYVVNDKYLPNMASPVYEEPIVIEEDTTIMAFAEKDGYEPSETVKAVYRTEAVPISEIVIRPMGQLVLEVGETAMLSADVLPADTTDDKTVTWSSSDVETAVVTAEGEVLAKKAGECVITAEAGGKSAECPVLVTGEGDVSVPVETLKTPVFSPEEGLVEKGEKITISSPDGADIYYTTDGTTPDENSSRYEEPVVIDRSMSIQAIAVKEGYQNSGVAFASYTVKEEADARGLWMMDIAPLSYTGKAVKPENIQVYYGAKRLTEGLDYTVSYKNNVKANTLEAETETAKAPAVVVKGKGNYTGQAVKNFAILPKNINDEDIQADDLAAAYKKGKINKPVPVVKWGSLKLANKKDFTAVYSDSGSGAYETAGSYKIQISGKGNYTGTRTITLTIAGEEERLISKASISIAPQDYSGQAVRLEESMISAAYKGSPLTMGTDYTLEYGNCVNAGTYEVLVKGKGEYKGVKRVKFQIKGISLKGLKTGSFENPVYTGSACTVSPEIFDKSGNLLTEGEDYELTYENNTKAGTARMVISGIGKYSGTVKKNFKILPYSMEDKAASLVKVEFAEGKSVPYEKGGAKPTVKVWFGEKLLTEGADYTVSYKNNNKCAPETDVKAPSVVIKGKGNFSKSRTVCFSIKTGNLDDVTVIAPDVTENKKAGKYKTKPVLIDANGKKLAAGKDYLKTFEYFDENGRKLEQTDNPACGSFVTVRVTGKGCYSGEKEVTYQIIPKGTDIAKAKVKIKETVYYTGAEIELPKDKLEVKLGNTVLKETDYEIIGYFNNRSKGTAQMWIQGKGEYGGVKQINFKIKPRIMRWQ